MPNSIATLDELTIKLREALALGDPQKVAALLDAGADIHYQAEEGYDALIDAVHGRDILHDPTLIELLTLLVDRGVSVTGESTYGESAVRILSWRGRFDAVQFLLHAGANPNDIQYTKLIAAVAFGTLADVESVVAQGIDLEERDHWERTAWLVAIQTGDIAKAKFLLDHGARRDVQGCCGQPPLFYAIENGDLPMLEWLLEIGMDVHETEEFGNTALVTAVQHDQAEAVTILIRAGADVNFKERRYGALSSARSRAVALLLLEAGADAQDVTSKSKRAILGYSPEPDAELLQVSVEDFRKYRARRFGTANPEVMNNPFWEGMIRSGLIAYQAEVRMEGDRDYDAYRGPIWCADRFGQSLTFLPDGRIVQVAGEHEDSYDPDFCIYNDVFVHDTDGNVTIYGYPKSVFPPTDFHTATLICDHIYLIGSIGYQGTRRFSTTPVYRLNVNTFHIEPVETTGENPGWIYEHRAVLTSDTEIQITGGKIASAGNPKASHDENAGTFTLNVETLVWTRS